MQDILTKVSEKVFIKSSLNSRSRDDNFKKVAISPKHAEFRKQQRKVLKSSPVKTFNVLAYCLTCKKKTLIAGFQTSKNKKEQNVLIGKCNCCGKGLVKFGGKD